MIFCLIIIEIIFAIIYFIRNNYSIGKYIFGITNKYINHLKNPKTGIIAEKNSINYIEKDIIAKYNNNNAPPKQNLIKSMKNSKYFDQTIINRKKSKRKTAISGNIKSFINNNKNMDLKNNIYINNNLEKNDSRRNSLISNAQNLVEFSNSSNKDLVSSKKSEIPNELNGIFLNIKDNLDVNIEEYLETQYDDMDFDEAIRKDQRKFRECFIEKMKNKQIIINTFYVDEPLKPKSIKLLFLILQIKLYFFINGLFYDEEYISKIYHLDKDTFFTMAERFFDNLIYAALAGIIINYIIEFFFIDELKLKKILKMEKNNIFILKYEMITVLKSIKTRYFIFIIFSFLISLIALVHIFCFNVIYYHTMKEWAIFSLIIILSIQLGSVLICLLQTILRFISFKFKSEKLFKLSI